jgi:uncharacterized membrane protein
MPHPTQPEGDMKVPKKTRSRVELWEWYVHAMEACWVGSVIHFSKVLVGVVVVQCAQNVTLGRERRKKRQKRKSILVVGRRVSNEIE